MRFARGTGDAIFHAGCSSCCLSRGGRRSTEVVGRPYAKSLKMTATDHNTLLRAAVGGDEQALTHLVRSYSAQLWRFGRRVCRDDLDAEDAVQEAFVRLARYPELQRAPGVLAWLRTVVKRICLRLLRRSGATTRRLGTRVEVDEEPDARITQEEGLERYRITELVRSAIAQLQSPYRAVIILRDIEGLSGPEVCSQLQISEAAMKSRLHRAREEVRQTLKPFIDAREQDHVR